MYVAHELAHIDKAVSTSRSPRSNGQFYDL